MAKAVIGSDKHFNQESPPQSDLRNQFEEARLITLSPVMRGHFAAIAAQTHAAPMAGMVLRRVVEVQQQAGF